MAPLLALALAVTAPASGQPASVTYLLDDSSATTPPRSFVPIWSRLANPGFANRTIKCALFFSGQARDGSNRYDCTPHPGNNRGLHTLPPLDKAHLRWSETSANRNVALAEMASAGIDVTNLSLQG